MVAIDFPNSPTVGQTFSASGRTWQWTGSTWDIITSNSTVFTDQFHPFFTV